MRVISVGFRLIPKTLVLARDGPICLFTDCVIGLLPFPFQLLEVPLAFKAQNPSYNIAKLHDPNGR